jgi:hypothetical protein
MKSNFLHGAGIMSIFVVGVVVAVIFLLVPFIFYIMTLQKTLNRCSAESRAIQPAMVWLLLVPCFNCIWHFFVVLKMTQTLGAEFQKRGLAGPPAPGKVLGLTMCALFCCVGIPVHFLRPLAFLGFLVCWILYWVKIAKLSRQLEPEAE